MTAPRHGAPAPRRPRRETVACFLGVFLHVGTLGFGGPVALVAAIGLVGFPPLQPGRVLAK